MDMKKILSIIAVLVVIGIVWVVVGAKKDEYVVKVGYLPISVSVPFFYAHEKGYFTEEGISIKAIEMQTSNQIFEAIARGDIDVTPELSLIPVLAGENVDKGRFKIYSVTDSTSAEPFDSLLVKKDSNIKDIAQLKGKKIGVFPGSTATAFLKKYLSDRNVDISATQFVPLPPASQLSALSAGSIDVLFAYEPLITIGTQSGEAKILTGSVISSFQEHNPLGVGIMSTKFINEHPELSGKVVSVFDKANTDIRNGTDFREVVATSLKLDEKVAKAFNHSYMTTSSEINKELFDKFVDILMSVGELKSKPDLSNIFYK